MGHVEHSARCAAPVGFAFAYVADYRNVPKWMFGIRHFTPVGEQTSGLGAVFDTALHLGPTTLQLRSDITEWVDDSRVTIRAIRGIEGAIRWDFAAVHARLTEITATADYRVPGGLAGRALDRVIQAFIGPAVRHTEKNLREKIEARYQESLRTDD
ncbi:polyketide cyclase/dehydrase/lipid transport protein [Nocardia tenerifensis]|uniref:Polyketide cyclase/dehydrase/lipid transport protein n=1 Tax=Nocardia tenerifensis TaxID=228006 RepID=A0A318KDI9_9NOCA|nr:SRPBCC family protein [Nocardia tenerifensis]PXX70955.1 polyketide cyclase/dehydrase/lipid transport protein [Nocardia tenerifensis]